MADDRPTVVIDLDGFGFFLLLAVALVAFCWSPRCAVTAPYKAPAQEDEE